VSRDISVEDAAGRFLAHKRALGRKYHSEEHELRLLSRFAAGKNAGLGDLTPALMEEFLGSRPRQRPRSFNHLLGVADGLFRWAVAQELLDSAPALPRPRKAASGRVPFLFTAVQARALLAAAALLPDNSRARGRGHVYQAIFALCYGLGLRAAEACGMRLGDIDAGRSLLTVRGGKFGKDRLVPHGPRIGALVAAQAERRRSGDSAAGPGSPLFTFDGRRSIHPGTASQAFHHLVPALALPVPDGVSPPRLHDLRHSFAVGCQIGGVASDATFPGTRERALPALQEPEAAR
jgi:integrase